MGCEKECDKVNQNLWRRHWVVVHNSHHGLCKFSGSDLMYEPVFGNLRCAMGSIYRTVERAHGKLLALLHVPFPASLHNEQCWLNSIDLAIQSMHSCIVHNSSQLLQ